MDNRLSLTSGLFSVQLGSVTSLGSVDFNQPLWLSVEVGSNTASSTWDGEMSPRKKIGAAPQAFNSDKLNGQASSYYLDANNLSNFISRWASVLSGTTTDALTEGTSSLYFTNARARNAISNTTLGLSYSTSTGAISLASGYVIPLSASTTDWQSFFATPSSRITAGQNLSWSSSTLGLSGVVAVANGGTGTSSPPLDGQFVYGASSTYAFVSTSTLYASTTSNRVGIGTSNPTSTLQVVGTTTLRSMLPDADALYDIGSASMRFHSLYLASSSIYLESMSLSNVGGALYVNGSPVAPTSTNALTEGGGNLYYTDARARNSLSTTAIGVSYSTSSGVLSLSSGYNIPLTASTSNWQNFFATPSSQISAGVGLLWSGNTLNGVPANATTDGLVSSSTQTFGGNKTFNGTVSLGGALSATGTSTLATTSATQFTALGASTLSAGLTLSALGGGILQASAGGIVSTTSIGALTSNSLSSAANILTSIVNSVTSTTTAVNSVSNTISANTLSTTVNGVTGGTVSIINSNALTSTTNTLQSVINGVGTTTASIINSNTLSWLGQTLTSTINGVSTTTIITYANATTDGLVSSSTQTLGGNKTFNGTVSLGSTLSVTGTSTLATTTVTQFSAGASTLSASLTLSALGGGILQTSVGGTVSTTSIAALTTHTLSSLANVLTSTVNGVSATSSTINSNALTSTTNTLQSVVNGVGTSTASIINSNALSWLGQTLTSTVNGVSTTTTIAYANVTTDGLISSSTQTLGGNKTFNGAVSLGSTLAVTGTSVLATTTAASLSIGSLSGLLFGASGSVGTIATSALGLLTTNVTEGVSLYYTDTRARSSLSSSATALTFATSSGVFSLTSGYNVPLGASTTNWNSFYDTPSTRITVGTGLSWSSNTLSAPNAFLTGGNSFGSMAQLGTNDSSALAFIASGTERMRLSATGGFSLGSSYVATDPGAGSMILSGNLGIGTTSASSRLLTIVGSSASNEGVYVKNSSTGGASIELYNSTGAGHDWSLVSGGSSNGSNSGNFFVYDSTGGAARLIISSSTGALSIPQLSSCGLGVTTNANGTLSCTLSDSRLKDIHGDYTRGLSSIVGIDPKVYSWKADSFLYDGGVLNYGFIAQNIQSVIPEAVATGSLGYLQISQFAIQAALVNATKDLARSIYGTTSTSTLALAGSMMPNGLIPELTSTSTATTTLSGDRNYFSYLSERLIAWLGSTLNGIGDIFAHRVVVDQLCVKDVSGAMTCLSKGQVDALLAGKATAGIGAGSTSIPTPSTEAPAPTSTSVDVEATDTAALPVETPATTASPQ